ncbi:class I SAM-dependent methyltransferase [Effusibacillus dendaii]|nr:class I SAM-dependent methyltransferase [Effusibacillus dendaii]
MNLTSKKELGIGLSAGEKHYRAFVGPPEKYDIVSAMQFNLLTFLGLREHHRLLDIGCGSLRVGRLLLPYLLPGNYFGIEPEEWLVKEGIKQLGDDLIELKLPSFLYRTDFPASEFGVVFDYAIAQSIFSHASQQQISQCLDQVKKCLAPHGILAATFISGDTDYDGTEWVYPGCVDYTEKTMAKLANASGLEFKIIDWPHPNGQTWSLFYHKDNNNEVPDPTYKLITDTRQQLPLIKVDQFIDEHNESVGSFDSMHLLGRKYILRGWSRNPITQRPSEKVIVTNENHQIISQTKIDVVREDVGQAYNSAEMNISGWEIYIDKKEIPSSTKRLFVYSYCDGILYKLYGEFEVKF